MGDQRDRQGGNRGGEEAKGRSRFKQVGGETIKFLITRKTLHQQDHSSAALDSNRVDHHQLLRPLILPFLIVCPIIYCPLSSFLRFLRCKKISLTGGFEPPTFRLTAERSTD